MSNLYGGLTAYNQFVIYEKIWDADKGKFNKKPCDLGGSRFDQATNTKFNHLDPANWSSFDEASLAVELLGDRYALGFVFSESTPFFFLDIDKCLVNGQWTPIVGELCNMFPGAYVEVSMSGTGIHIVGSLSQRIEHGCRNREHSLEFYTEARFMALGNPNTARGDVHTNHDVSVATLVGKYFDPTNNVTGTQALTDGNWTTTHNAQSRPILNDEALVAKAMKSSSASSVFGDNTKATFAELWTAADSLGDYFPPDNPKDPFDRSGVDSALATHLMFWTGGDCERTMRLMRSSALYREKYDRDDYMYRTISGAFTTHSKGGADYYSMTDEVIEVIKPCDAAIDLAETIQARLETYINKAVGQSVAGQQANINVNVQALDQIITRSFWSGSKSKLFVLTDDNVLNMYVEKDMIRIAEKYFGHVVEPTEIELYAAQIAELGLSSDDEDKVAKTLNGIAYNILVDHLKMKNQRDKLSSTVDMFASRPRMEWSNDSVKNVYIWRPLPMVGDIDQTILNDYKQHFPMCDNLLRQIVAARFASDRKKCFTWLKADSDWGKGVLTSALEELGLLVELSVAETEKAFEGAPMAKDASLFTHAFVVCFNEFKMVKSELKQIENKLPVSPKNQLMQTVDIYHKLFTSAESVDSLVGEYGVETQFQNRFSYIEGCGSISIRDVFTGQGKYRYFNTVKAYIAKFINNEVQRYIAMERETAIIEADKFVESFHRDHGIAQTFEGINDNLPSLIQSFKEWVIKVHAAPMPGTETYLYNDDSFYYMKSPSKLFNDWLEQTTSRSERMTLGKKKNDILNMMSPDGRVMSHRVNGIGFKGLKFEM